MISHANNNASAELKQRSADRRVTSFISFKCAETRPIRKPQRRRSGWCIVNYSPANCICVKRHVVRPPQLKLLNIGGQKAHG
jgi:hypothetical protein